MPQTKLTISEAAELLGIVPKVIRHYHEVGVLPEPERSEGGYRLYTAADLHRIRAIRELQAFGLSLKQIKFILDSDEADVHLRAFLAQRDEELSEQIYHLQQQQARVRAFLQGENSATFTPSHEILHSVIKPVSNTLADVLVAVEKQVLTEIDRLTSIERCTPFWEHLAQHFAKSMRPHEHLLILWLERYLALDGMLPDDKQAQAWLAELHDPASRAVLSQVLVLPPSDTLPLQEQSHIQQLLPILLYEHATPLQKTFLAALQSLPKR